MNEGTTSIASQDTPFEALRREILGSEIDKVSIILHSNPDPDCIGAAMGLDKLLRSWNPNIKCSYLYSGEISHSQNKTLVNVLNIPLVDIDEARQEDEEDHINITVDVIPERCLKPEEECLMAIDHHRNDTKRAKITDIRNIGSTSTIIWEYLRNANVEFDKTDDLDMAVATALLVGIKTDTADFISETTTDLDWQASQYLMEYVDRSKLSSIVNYSYPAYQFELRSKLDDADNVRSDNGVFAGGLGFISPAKRDILPTMADERYRVEGIDTAFVFAIVGEYIEVSIRTVGLSVDVNTLCHKIFGKEYAGGKQGAGAAKIPLGFLSININAPEEVKVKMWDAVKELVIDKIFHVMSGNA